MVCDSVFLYSFYYLQRKIFGCYTVQEIYLCGKKLEKAANEEYWGFKTEREASLKSTADQKEAEEEESKLKSPTEDALSGITDQAAEGDLEEPNMESNAEANEEGVKMDKATEIDKEKEDEQRAVPMKWVNKAVMANILAEGLSDTQVKWSRYMLIFKPVHSNCVAAKQLGLKGIL